MDLINKPRRAVRRLINRVSIQTLMKNGEGDEVEPFGITRGSSRAWAEPMQEDMRDPKVCIPIIFTAISFISLFHQIRC